MVAGDSVYQPLSVGLAHMLTTDLALLGRFPLVERIRLGGNVDLEDREVVELTLTEGELRELLELQKDYSARVAEALGYGLTEAERRRMDENRPANLIALLTFSRGLMAEDAGDFAGAASHFRAALSADPHYGEAQERFRSPVGANVVSRAGPGEIVQVVSRVDQARA